MQHLWDAGIAVELARLASRGTAFVGVCGGYQMLGTRILDPTGVESERASVEGLGLLLMTTHFTPGKETHQVSGQVAADRGLLAGARGLRFRGYEIHMGATTPDDGEEVMGALRLTERSGRDASTGDGALSGDGWVFGSYVHGLFENADLRKSLMGRVAARKGVSLPQVDDGFSQSREYDRLADHFSASLDMEAVYGMLELGGRLSS